MLVIGVTAYVWWHSAQAARAYGRLNAAVAADPGLVDALADAPDAPEPVTLLVIDYGDADVPPSGAVFALLRTDSSARRSWLLGLPPGAAIDTPGGTTLTKASDTGEAALIGAVRTVTGIAPSHYARVDVQALAAWIERRGGLALPPDPEEGAGATGAMLADEAGVAGFLRVENGAEMTRERYRRVHRLLAAVAKAVRAEAGLKDRAAAIDASREWLSTDLSGAAIEGVVRALGSDDAGAAQSAYVPVVALAAGPVMDGEALATIAEAFGSGADLPSRLSEGRTVSPATVSVTVQNGAGLAGVAAQAAGMLTAAGFPVVSVANANQFVYDTTLVVYRDDALAADRVLKELPVGRRVASRGMYLFDTDILVVVGKDWPEDL